MALIAYDKADAAAFEATRHLGDDTLGAWREAITRYLDPQPGMRLLDLGCGTGSWSQAFRAWWPATDVLAVEPSAAMRERAIVSPVLAGNAAGIPADDASIDAVWLSTVVHHVPDLDRNGLVNRCPRSAGTALTARQRLAMAQFRCRRQMTLCRQARNPSNGPPPTRGKPARR